MKITVQVVTTTDDGQEFIRELACIEREELTAKSLGLSVADGKAILLSQVTIQKQTRVQTGKARLSAS